MDVNLGRCFLTLKHLQLSSVSIKNPSFVSQISCCKSLEHLELHSCHNLNLTDKDLENISTLISLKHLTISEIYRLKITAKGMSAIFQHCTALQSLNLSGMTDLESCIPELAKNCKNLQHLNLVCWPFLTNEDLIMVAQNCKNLKSLELGVPGGGQCLTDDSVLIEISKNCLEFESLKVSSAVHITDIGFNALGNCKSLKSLYLDVPSLKNPAPMCLPLLTNVDILGSLTETLNFTGCVALKNLDLNSLRQLKELNCTGCVSLEMIRLTSCTVKEFIMTGCAALKEVYYTSSPIPKSFFIQIAQNAPALTCLDLSYSGGFTDEELVAVAKGCKSIERVDIGQEASNSSIGDKTLLALVQHCPNLTSLDMNFSTVTDAGLLELVKLSLPNLKFLGLSNVDVSREAKDKVIECFPSLDGLDIGIDFASMPFVDV